MMKVIGWLFRFFLWFTIVLIVFHHLGTKILDITNVKFPHDHGDGRISISALVYFILGCSVIVGIYDASFKDKLFKKMVYLLSPYMFIIVIHILNFLIGVVNKIVIGVFGLFRGKLMKLL